MRSVAAAWLAVGALLVVGCSASVKVGGKKKAAEPAAEPVRPVEAPAQSPPGGARQEPRLVGLPMTGSQIDVLGDIEFSVNSATIEETPKNIGLLNTLAAAGKAYPQITKLRVEGHTDSDGDDASNQDLSDRRAHAVVDWLVAHGIERGRLLAVGCGERDPLQPNTTQENKQSNRRTEFDIEEVDGKRHDLATTACEPNTYRKGYVTLNAPDWDGSNVSFVLDKTVFPHTTQAKLRFSRPLAAPKGQQYWVTLVKAGAPDADNGAWHYIPNGATEDTVELFKSDDEDFEIRLHDVYPKYPHRVIHRQRIKVLK